jgi:flavin-dependent dehydrogenase
VDPKALDELLPDWREDGCPLAETPVTDNWHWVLTKSGKYAMPHAFMPPFMSNDGCYTASLGTCAAGWRARRKSWASRSSPASRRRSAV